MNVNNITNEIKKGKIFKNTLEKIHFNKIKNTFMYQSIFSGRWIELDDNEVKTIIEKSLKSKVYTLQ